MYLFCHWTIGLLSRTFYLLSNSITLIVHCHHPIFIILFLSSSPLHFHVRSVYMFHLSQSISHNIVLFLIIIFPSISHLFIISLSIPINQLILTSFLPLTLCQITAHSIFVSIACSVASTLLTCTIHLPFFSPVISASHLYYCSAAERYFPSVSLTQALLFYVH